MDEIKDILRAIRSGCNPITGEIFDTKILSDDPTISREILKLALQTQSNVRMKKLPSVNALGRDANAIFKELKAWRLGVAHIINLPAYYVFSDKDLWEIAKGDVVEIDDLLFIKGINLKKYELYAEEVYAILKPFIENSGSTPTPAQSAISEPDVPAAERNADKAREVDGESEEEIRDFLERKKMDAKAAEEDDKPPVASCKNCMLYRSEECFGEKEICEFYSYAPTISKAEIDNWPKEMEFRRRKTGKRKEASDRSSNTNKGKSWVVRENKSSNSNGQLSFNGIADTCKSETRVVKRSDCENKDGRK